MSLSIKELKSSGAIYELNNISRGIEKEGLRVSPSGEISKNNHPNRLGSALTNPYLTTDFSEALLELITPVFNMPSECLDFLSEIHSFVIDGIEDELIWPFSMPPSIDAEEDVRIGSYGKSNSGMMKTIYRRGLANRYGRKMQAIAGIHYNFSFSDAFFEKLDPKDVQNKKNEVYLSIARNFKRQEWLYFYLYGSSPAINKNFTSYDVSGFNELNANELIKPYATTLRMGDLGYISKVQDELNISFNSLEDYLEGLKLALKKPYKAYEEIGEFSNDERIQLNTSIIQIENEYYNTIRPKRVCASGERPVNVLENDGINYLELRCVDLNPFNELGIDQEEINFLDLIMLKSALEESPPISNEENKEIKENHQRIVNEGNKPELKLIRNGNELSLVELANLELEKLQSMLEEIAGDLEDSDSMRDSLSKQSKRVKGEEETISKRIIRNLEKTNSFQNLGLSLAETHKETLRNKTFKDQNRLIQAANTSIEEQQEIELRENQSFEAHLKEFLAKIS